MKTLVEYADLFLNIQSMLKCRRSKANGEPKMPNGHGRAPGILILKRKKKIQSVTKFQRQSITRVLAREKLAQPRRRVVRADDSKMAEVGSASTQWKRAELAAGASVAARTSVEARFSKPRGSSGSTSFRAMNSRGGQQNFCHLITVVD